MKVLRNVYLRMTSTAVSMVGVLALVGWEIGSKTLTSIRDGWVTMKPLTALCFLLAGFISYGVPYTLSHRYKIWDLTTTMFSMWIFFFMALLSAQYLLGASVSIENIIFNSVEDDAIKSVGPGIPSLGTMVGFVAVSGVGVMSVFNTKKFYPRCRFSGWCLIGLSTVALVGYCLDIPRLYYFIPEKSTAMAINTALGFLVFGVNCLLFKPFR